MFDASCRKVVQVPSLRQHSLAIQTKVYHAAAASMSLGLDATTTLTHRGMDELEQSEHKDSADHDFADSPSSLSSLSSLSRCSSAVTGTVVAMDLKLNGKTALVTGGSRGIGRAVAQQLSSEGATVAIVARDADRVRSAAEELSARTGGRVVGLVADMGREGDVRRVVAEATAAIGPISILVNNAATAAGRARPPALGDITREKLINEIDVKVLGYLFAAQAVAPGMIGAGWGRIINIAGLAARSTGSTIGSIRNVAVAALTKNLADELGPNGVNVTCVHPGLTRTRSLDEAIDEEDRGLLASIEERITKGNSIRSMIDADDIAVIVAFLASPLSLAINGDAIMCGGGSPGTIYY